MAGKTICQLQPSSKMDKDQTLPSPSARTEEPRPQETRLNAEGAKAGSRCPVPRVHRCHRNWHGFHSLKCMSI